MCFHVNAATFKFLNEGIDHIMNNLKQGMSYSKYMDLYTYARL
jgi:cullin 1